MIKLHPHEHIDISGYMRRSITDEHDEYRLMLQHRWGNGDMDLYIGANPSTAGYHADDPTVRFFKKSSSHRGMGGFYVANPIPKRASKPPIALEWLQQFDSIIQPVLDLNWETIKQAAENSTNVIICWGAILPPYCDPLKETVYQILRDAGRSKWQCFGVTKDGHPKHPMAQGPSAVSPLWPLVPWSPHGSASTPR
jgi:hypothetical protein